jgi:anti-sigma regulatory factor (Ser/Thr protein kinase)
MRCDALPEAREPEGAFRHEALLYAGGDAFLDGATSFIRAALTVEEPVLVMVGAAKIDALRAELGDADGVLFADMEQVGSNPARIIPAWREFVSGHAGSARRLRGIGEPIWSGRGQAELVECQRHESLLNLAFADARGFHLLCPYDTAALDPAVVDEARRTHPFVMDGGVPCQSASYCGVEPASALFGGSLPEPLARPEEHPFGADSLVEVRALVSGHAADLGLSAARTYDAVIAVNELAANTVRHAGGQGVMRIWREGETLICEVRDRGRLEEPLAGRVRPAGDQESGFGLWMANQLCDLVQMRSSPEGTVVRVHVRAPGGEHRRRHGQDARAGRRGADGDRAPAPSLGEAAPIDGARHVASDMNGAEGGPAGDLIEVLDRGHELFLELFALKTARAAAERIERLSVEELRAGLLAQLEIVHHARDACEGRSWAASPPDLSRWLGERW